MAKIEVKLKKTLPDSEIYEEVEYIEGSAVQYIKLDGDVDYNLVCRYFKFMAKNDTDNSARPLYKLYSQISAINSDTLAITSVNNTFMKNDILTGTLWGGRNLYGGFVGRDDYRWIEVSTNISKVIGKEQQGATTDLTQATQTPVRVPDGSAVDYITIIGTEDSVHQQGYIRFCEFKYGTPFEWVSDIVPCVRKSDQVAGVYDKIKKKFYTNSGTGSFTVGNKTGVEYADDTYVLDQYNGLKSVSSLSQSNGQAGEIYYGVVPSSGSIEAVDVDGKIAELINKGYLPNSNIEVEIYANDNLIHKHISSDSNYTVLDKKYTMQLSDVLAEWDNKKYNGYAYTGESQTSYAMLVSVLKSFGFTDDEIDAMLEEVAGKLQSIVISIPFLAKDTYRATIDKFCQLAQMQVYQNDDGVIKFVESNHIRDGVDVIPIPMANQLKQLNTSIIFKNKYDAVDITPSQLIVENEDAATSGELSPSNKELTDVVTFVNNPTLTVESVGDYWEDHTIHYLEGQSQLCEECSGAKIEVYYKEGYVLINKPSDEQYLDFSYTVELSGKKYAQRFTWTNSWDSNTWYNSGITSNTLYTSAGQAYSDPTWEGSSLLDSGVFSYKGDIQVDNLATDYRGNSIGKTVNKTIANTFTVEELVDSYKIHYKIPVGCFVGRQYKYRVVNTQNWTYQAPSHVNVATQADSLQISIVASTLTKKDLDTVRVGNGTNVYTYPNNELLSIDTTQDITYSQYYKNAQTIIAEYHDGLATGEIEITCNDYTGKDWDNGEVVETNDIIKIGGLQELSQLLPDNYSVAGREFVCTGVPKIKLQLQESLFQVTYFDGTTLVGQEGVRNNKYVQAVPSMPMKDSSTPGYKLVCVGWYYFENGTRIELTYAELNNLKITKPYNFNALWELKQVTPV